jgi:hypothetical protein
MADIDVVPKRSTNLWLWIILAIALLAIMWAVMSNGASETRVGQLHDLQPGSIQSELVAGTS